MSLTSESLQNSYSTYTGHMSEEAKRDHLKDRLNLLRLEYVATAQEIARLENSINFRVTTRITDPRTGEEVNLQSLFHRIRSLEDLAREVNFWKVVSEPAVDELVQQHRQREAERIEALEEAARNPPNAPRDSDPSRNLDPTL